MRLALVLVVAVFALPGRAGAQIQGSGFPADLPLEVGANYHATSPVFETSTFINRYHQGSFRTQVRAQLDELAKSGATTIKTTLWLVDSTAPWGLSFPLSSQHLTNIETYVRDVAAVQRPDGRPLNLQLTLAWLGCADYPTGSVSGTVGQCNLSWQAFLNAARSSITSLFNRVGFLTRSDGRRAVDLVYLDLEVMIGAKANQDQFLRDLYPFFLAEASRVGVAGSI